MESLEKKHITLHKCALIHLIDSNDILLAKLSEKDVVSEEDVQEIQSSKTKIKRARKLIDTLMKKTNSYQIFTKALIETQQSGAAHILNSIEHPVDHPNQDEPPNKKSLSFEQQSFWEQSDNGCDYKSERINFDVRSPNYLFTGRKQQLDDLQQRLNPEGPRAAAIQLTVISGLGGIGKTELCRKYIELNQQHYSYIIWINAEREDTAQEGFLRLANDKLNIVTKNAHNEDQSFTSVLEKVYTYFANQAGATLIVLNNAENMELLKKILDPLRCPKLLPNIPLVLITSRKKEWSTDTEVIFLDQMEKNDAIKLVQRVLPNESIEEIIELVKILHYFPLAILQAVSYINQEKIKKPRPYRITDFIETYKANPKRVLKSKTFMSGFNDYTKTTFNTWSLTIEAISENEECGKLAIKILQCMAYFSAEGIPITVFQQLAKDEDIDLVEDAFQLLSSYSMVKAQDETYSIHRLLQEVMQLQMQDSSEEKTVLDTCLQLFSSHVPANAGEHAVSVWSHASKYPEILTVHSSVSAKIIECLTEQGKYRASHEFSSATVKILGGILDKEHTTLYDIEKKRAKLYFRDGQFETAKEMYTKLINKIKSKENYDEEEYLQLEHQIGRILRRQGNYKESFEHVSWVIQRREELGRNDDDEYYDCLHGQVSTAMRLGNYQFPLVYSPRILKYYKNSYGEDSEKYLNFEQDYGMLYGEMGDFQKSVEILSKVYDKLTQLLGHEHRRTLRCGHNLAFYLTQGGQYKKGYELYEEVYERRKELEGKDHPRTILTLDCMAECLNFMGKYDKAFHMLINIHKSYCTLYGKNNSKTLLCLAAIATSLSGRGGTDEALHTFEIVLGKLKDVLGDCHMEVCKIKLKTAKLLETKQDYDGAMRLLDEIEEATPELVAETTQHPVFKEALQLKNKVISYINDNKVDK